MSSHMHYPQTLQQNVQPVRTYPAGGSYLTSNYAVSAGIFGTVVGGTAALAANLHKVQDDRMTMKQAFVDSLAKGAGAGVATAAAAGVASSFRTSGFTSFVLMAATATGVGYVLNSMGKSVSEKNAGASKKA